MITCMSDLICVTNRKLCNTDFLLQIENIAKTHPKAIILREKDLSDEEYFILAQKVMDICRKSNTPCILHNFVSVAIKLGCRYIHLPLSVLQNMTLEEKQHFQEIGASCHSVNDAIYAKKLGCTYITAGHIFDTNCKKGLPGRGLNFLQAVCQSIDLPVYAIGGIGKDNYSSVKKAGAMGACIMSGFMRCDNASQYIKEITNEI